jgi:hypothetical protein
VEYGWYSLGESPDVPLDGVVSVDAPATSPPPALLPTVLTAVGWADAAGIAAETGAETTLGVTTTCEFPVVPSGPLEECPVVGTAPAVSNVGSIVGGAVLVGTVIGAVVVGAVVIGAVVVGCTDPSELGAAELPPKSGVTADGGWCAPAT